MRRGFWVELGNVSGPLLAVIMLGSVTITQIIDYEKGKQEKIERTTGQIERLTVGVWQFEGFDVKKNELLAVYSKVGDPCLREEVPVTDKTWRNTNRSIDISRLRYEDRVIFRRTELELIPNSTPKSLVKYITMQLAP